MPQSGFQIYFWSRVTLTLTSWTPKLIISCPCPVDHFGIKIGSFGLKVSCVYKFGSRRTDERIDGRTDGRTDRLPVCPRGRIINLIFEILYQTDCVSIGAVIYSSLVSASASDVGDNQTETNDVSCCCCCCGTSSEVYVRRHVQLAKYTETAVYSLTARRCPTTPSTRIHRCGSSQVIAPLVVVFLFGNKLCAAAVGRTQEWSESDGECFAFVCPLVEERGAEPWQQLLMCIVGK